ncbi:MAG: hypothetical protein H6Q07_2954, partial [Acidobacteria bacterium]|nr:hypothetical protein [Acidobacteriota bacterium]
MAAAGPFGNYSDLRPCFSNLLVFGKRGGTANRPYSHVAAPSTKPSTPR